MWSHLLTLGLIDGAGGGVFPPTPSAGANSFAGGRQAYRYRGKSYYLTPYELARMLDEDRADRQEVQIKRKRRHRSMTVGEWERVMAALSAAIPDMPVEMDSYDDEEAALQALVIYL